VSIVPNRNLVSNIGFGEDATHTKAIERFSMLPSRSIDFPLQHPPRIHVDRAADKFAYYVHFRNVRHASVIWLYELWDFAYRHLKSLKRALIRSPFFTKSA
jgi:hypothetical protein